MISRYLRGGFTTNLALLIAVGVSSLYWLGYHTESLEVVGGLLGLGGVFAWIAFMGKLIKDDRIDYLQDAFDTWLSSPRTTGYCLFLVLMLAIVSLLGGSIQIDSRQDNVDRFIEIFVLKTDGNGDEKVRTEPAYHADLVKARTKHNFPLFTDFGSRDYEIQVDGLPALKLSVNGFSRTKLAIPHAFLRRNILLLRPNSALTQTLKKSKEPNTLLVKIGRDSSYREYSIPNYRGESIWIGCEDSVAIPERLQESWRLELLALGAPQANMLSWLSPISIAKGTTLKRGEPVEINIKYPDEVPWNTTQTVIKDCGRPGCFPQEVVMKK